MDDCSVKPGGGAQLILAVLHPLSSSPTPPLVTRGTCPLAPQNGLFAGGHCSPRHEVQDGVTEPSPLEALGSQEADAVGHLVDIHSQYCGAGGSHPRMLENLGKENHELRA